MQNDTVINKKTLTAEAVKNGLPIPQITFLWMRHNWKVIYCVKSEVLDLESNLLFLGGEGGRLGVIYYTQLEGNLLHKIRKA